MNWLQKTAFPVPEISPQEAAQEVETQSTDFTGVDWNSRYPLAGNVVSGLRVSEQIDNMSSINASLYQYEILPNVREVPMSDFGSPKPCDNFYARTDIERCRSLASEIRESGEIMPLIIVVDDKGPYILEGGHRFVALHELGVQTFPALVVVDLD
ncbi:hypothetical protein LCGC14_2815330 [marine sediment metagenome]|uniref:ParB-like N-terminal domain-containing protein n=1 Tax=marine sediment metagenome TaxID=412755 RepID=A0A0F9AS20_9ZZZZ